QAGHLFHGAASGRPKRHHRQLGARHSGRGPVGLATARRWEDIVDGRRRAFTLFEVVLVLALMVILGALAYPNLDSLYSDFRWTQASDQVRACWAEARAHAMNEGRTYRFAVVNNSGNYRLAPDSSEFWASNSGAPPPTSSTSSNANNPPYQEEDVLPKGVR